MYQLMSCMVKDGIDLCKQFDIPLLVLCISLYFMHNNNISKAKRKNQEEGAPTTNSTNQPVSKHNPFHKSSWWVLTAPEGVRLIRQATLTHEPSSDRMESDRRKTSRLSHIIKHKKWSFSPKTEREIILYKSLLDLMMSVSLQKYKSVA